MSEIHPSHHLKIVRAHMDGNGGLGRYVLLPGSPGRAEKLAALFDEVTEEVITPRHNDTYLGVVTTVDGRRLDVAATSTGMGPGSTEIVAGELIQHGARRLIRVGTSGAVSPKVPLGAQVIATGAVRDELASRHYVALEYPAVAHPDWVLAGERAAGALGIAERTYRGVVHTKASLWARATGAGPLGPSHAAYKEQLAWAGVLASEMEASVLFVLAHAMSEAVPSLADERPGRADVVKAGTVLGIIGAEEGWAGEERVAEIESETCRFAVETVRQLGALELGPA